MIAFETYRLTLNHYFVDDKGNRHKLEEPCILEYSIDRADPHPPVPFIINSMMDRFKQEILRMKDGGNDFTK